MLLTHQPPDSPPQLPGDCLDVLKPGLQVPVSSFIVYVAVFVNSPLSCCHDPLFSFPVMVLHFVIVPEGRVFDLFQVFLVSHVERFTFPEHVELYLERQPVEQRKVRFPGNTCCRLRLRYRGRFSLAVRQGPCRNPASPCR